MVTVVVVIRRTEGMSREEFLRLSMTNGIIG